MQTTVDIPDDLLRRAEAVARHRSVTLNQLMDEGLRVALERHEERQPATNVEPFVVTGRPPGPDLSWNRLSELLYGTPDDPADR